MIGQRIKDLRVSLGLNQTEFAEKVGSAQAVLSYVENGHALPNVELVKSIVATYRHKGVTYEWLLDGNHTIKKEKPTKTLTDARVAALAKNIARIIEMEKCTIGAFAFNCQIEPERLNDILEQRALPTIAELFNILGYCQEYNANWLLRGRGMVKLADNNLEWEDMLQAHKELVETLSKKLAETPKFTSGK